MFDDRLPQPFGRYVLRARVGAGGMAEVFRASLPGFGGFEKPVAIKRMFRQYGHDAQFIEMLTDEAKIVSQLAHPNIVQILDVGQQNEEYYIAFEFVEGVDLFSLLQSHHELGRDLPVGMAVYIISELASGLDYAHSRRTADNLPLGIVHRDVSPQNVLLSLQGEVKLTDFGIAKAAYRFTHTQAGMVKGKIYYMSPEQALGHAIDHRSDLFAAGILLFETLVTRPLYDEDDQKILYDRVCRADYSWPPERVGTVPQRLKEIVERALNVDPQQRYQSGRLLREALLSAARDLNLSCDRDVFGAYLRAMYNGAEDVQAPIAVPKLRPTTVHGETERWNSVVAAMPTTDDGLEMTSPNRTAAVVPGVRATPPPPARSISSLPPALPPTLPATKPQPRLSPAPLTLRPQPKSEVDLEDTTAPRKPQNFVAPAADAGSPSQPPLPPLPALGAPSGGPPQPPPPPGYSEQQTAAGVAGLPPSLAATAPRPMPRPMPARPSQPLPRELPTAAALRPPSGIAAQQANARPPSQAQKGQVADGESTSLLDPAEIAKRLQPQLSEHKAPSPPSAATEAATRFVQIAPDDDPRVEQNSPPPVPQRAPPRSGIRVQLPPQAPEPLQIDAPELDADEQPASWQLIGITAFVWTGVLLLGVYATLLMFRR